MNKKIITLLGVALTTTANAADFVQGDASVGSPLIINNIDGNPGLFAEITLTNVAGATAYVPTGTTSAPYSNISDYVRIDGLGGDVTVMFFSSYDLATNTGTAGTYTGSVNFFDVDTFQQSGATSSDQVTYSLDGGSDVILNPLTASIDNTNDKQGFIDSGLVSFDALGVNTINITNSGTGNFLLDTDFGFAAVPEPSSTALLGLGGLAFILRRRR